MSAISRPRRFSMPAVLVIAILALTGCVTVSGNKAGGILDYLGRDASGYAVIPVRSNRLLLDRLVALSGERKTRESLTKALDRSETLALAQGAQFRLAARGSFPRLGSSLIFSRSKGWTKISEKGIGSWFHSASFDASIPVSGLVLVTTGGKMPAFLESHRIPEPVPVSASFANFADNPASDGRIGVFFTDTKALMAAILGPDVNLPIVSAEVFAKPEMADQEFYRISAILEMFDQRSARALMTLLRMAKVGNPELDTTRIIITDYRVSLEQIAKMAVSLYLK